MIGLSQGLFSTAMLDLAPLLFLLPVIVCVIALNLSLRNRVTHLTKRAMQVRAMLLDVVRSRDLELARLRGEPEPARMTIQQLEEDASVGTRQVRRLLNLRAQRNEANLGGDASERVNRGWDAEMCVRLDQLEVICEHISTLRRMHNDAASHLIRLRRKKSARILRVFRGLAYVDTLEFDDTL